MLQNAILILDFGSQYTQLIARRIREQKVYCEIWPFHTAFEKIREAKPKGLILSGGPSSVYDVDAPQMDPAILTLGIPVLGICYGLHLLVNALGGEVKPAQKREYGRATVHLESDLLFTDITTRSLEVWMSHGDEALRLPSGFIPIASTASAPIAAMVDHARNFYAVQFHPEVVHTQGGVEMIRNFVHRICGLGSAWTMEHFLESEVRKIRTTVGADDHVLCALSGGVDSSVVAALLGQAIPKQLTCVFVDTGLLRQGERQLVEQVFKDHFKLDLRVIDASERFFKQLAGVVDPEQKRKRIGQEFISVFEEIAKPLNCRFLAQGTLYPDVIESVSVRGPSQTIKSHHNVGGLPEVMALKLIEPLRELFKDEVRVLGRELGLPDKMTDRQPFPGPGLAVRILGEVTPEKVDILQRAEVRLEDELRASNCYQGLWQAFAVLLPVKSVGVMGDQRTYAYTIAIRAVTSMDGMTADVADIPTKVLTRIANRIINEVPEINRVVYDISQKPPATIEWE